MPTILVVEDEMEIRSAIVELLEIEGYNAVTAANGMEALDYLRNNQRPCLIMLDMMMPVMDGQQFRQEQLKHDDWANIPVLIVSAADNSKAIAEQLGAAGFLRKPVTYDLLVSSVQQLCSN